MLNQWVGIGRMVDGAEMRYTQSGKAVANFRLAVDNGKDGHGNKDTLFATIVCWEKTAETIANYGAKGRLLAVSGRWTQRSYDADNGKRTVYEVVATNIQFLDRGDNKPAAGADEEIP